MMPVVGLAMVLCVAVGGHGGRIRGLIFRDDLVSLVEV